MPRVVTAVAVFIVCATMTHGRQDVTPTSFSVRVFAAGNPLVPLGHARVRYALEGDESVGGQVRTGADGTRLVSDLREGVYTLEVAVPGYAKRTDASVVVVEQATTEVDIVLEPEPTSVRHVRFGALLFGGVVLVATMVRGKARAARMQHE